MLDVKVFAATLFNWLVSAAAVVSSFLPYLDSIYSI